ncbi:glycolate oxidase subunit GlcE [Arhodomonas aquaeolei]|uniref:glycolate oxidase subunit GlcE n=1 Tax=Arhodomonas aquaeolei TaxID=2369 RepID=UPI00037B012E|nr:glycolate oxidase subunit GlcE [Arhodomonas aquaeolei]
METGEDRTEYIAEAVRDAAAASRALSIAGSGSKAFYGRTPTGTTLDVSSHRGIVNYAPTELILTARAGTPLAEIEAALAGQGQMLPFEPPHFGGGGTLGGAVAAGLAGPRRPFTGAVRDMVLGLRLVNGNGEVLHFGGEVMKNVAGYDLSRLNTGALGTLGVILEVTVKVLPRPETEASVRLELPAEALHGAVEGWLRQGVPVSAAVHDGEAALLRLSGTHSGVEQGLARVGGEALADAATVWADWRDHRHPFFARTDTPLWRIALPPGQQPEGLPGEAVTDWAGQQLWLRTDADTAAVRGPVTARGGHAALFAGGDRDSDVFQPLSPVLMRAHRRVKQAFDPGAILNPGRLYPE